MSGWLWTLAGLLLWAVLGWLAWPRREDRTLMTPPAAVEYYDEHAHRWGDFRKIFMTTLIITAHVLWVIQRRLISLKKH